MADSGPKPGEGTDILLENVKDPEQVGDEAGGVWIFLSSRRTISVALQCRDVCGYPPVWDGSWGGFNTRWCGN